jgi:hypothetical protein
MKTMKAMKSAKAMKTTKAMKSAKATGYAKLMKAMKKSATATCHAKLMKAIDRERSVHEKAPRMYMNAKQFKLMKDMNSKCFKNEQTNTMVTEIIMRTEIIEISYETNWGNMWWSLPAGESAELMQKFRAIGSGPKVVRFDWQLPEGSMHWQVGPDGEPTTNTDYIWDLDHLKQRNMNTHLERNFRIIRMNAMLVT